MKLWNRVSILILTSSLVVALVGVAQLNARLDEQARVVDGPTPVTRIERVDVPPARERVLIERLDTYRGSEDISLFRVGKACVATASGYNRGMAVTVVPCPEAP